jgi:hypothetical protein
MALVLAAVIVASILNAVASVSFDQHVALYALIATVSAFFLAALAAVVAVFAYRAATQKPSLVLNGRVEVGPTYTETFEFTVGSSSRLRMPIDEHLRFFLNVTNLLQTSARNPAVRVRILGPQVVYDNVVGWNLFWSPGERNALLLWDGGADYMIHGDFDRPLPLFDVIVRGVPNAPTKEERDALSARQLSIVFDVAADGFRDQEMLRVELGG